MMDALSTFLQRAARSQNTRNRPLILAQVRHKLLQHPILHRHPHWHQGFCKALSKRPDLRLTIADKNLGLTAMTTKEYQETLHQEHLSHLAFYLPINWSEYQTSLARQARTLTALPLRKYDRLQVQSTFAEPQLPRIRLLPKLHKPTFSTRLIVNATKAQCSGASRLLNKWLAPCLRKLPNNLTNRQQLQEAIRELSEIHPNLRVFTGDIVAMYPNVNLELCDQLLQHLRLVTERSLMNAIHADFHFWDEETGTIFQQVQGLPMGANHSGSLANLYLGHLLDPKIQPPGLVLHQ